MQIGATFFPSFWKVEGADIGTDGVDAVVLSAVVVIRTGLDVRRGVGVRIFHVAIDGAVVALHFPVGWHRDGVPGRRVEALLEEVERTLRGFAHEVETPRAVEREIARRARCGPGRGVIFLVGKHFSFRGIRHIVGNGLLFVDAEDGFVLPVGRSDVRLLDGFKREPGVAVFGIERHRHHLPVFQGIHHAFLLGAVGDDEVNAFLSSNGLEAKLGIVPYAFFCWPLQEVLDGGVAAAVVEVLVVEGVGNDAAVEVEHADVPILATVERIGLLADDGGTVFAGVAITQNEFRMGNRADAVGQRHVKSRLGGFADIEMGRLVGLRLLLGDERHTAVAGNGGGYLWTIGGNEDDEAFANALCFPELGFVRTVVLARCHL